MQNKLNSNYQAFVALVRAGLWEEEVCLLKFGEIDFSEIYRLAEEQSVVGLVAAGLERVKDVKVPQSVALSFVDEVLQLEQRNRAMNGFVAELIEKLRSADIYTLLVKGQGIAQCYERPLWRASGDVDLYLSKDNYEKAKVFLIPLAQHIETEDKKKLHLGMSIEGWIVELHGTMYTYISRRINKVNDEVHRDIFFNRNVRSWNDNGVQVFLPSANNDAIIVFNHFINHFYGEGVGLRQICDWCRLLYTYRGSLDYGLLESRIRKAGLMDEWRAFAVFALEYLGMPEEAMPLLPSGYRFQISGSMQGQIDQKSRTQGRVASYKSKAEKICWLIIETGSFGQKKDVCYRERHLKMFVNFITLWRRFKEFSRIATIFPKNAPKFYVTYVINRFKAVV